MKTIFLRTSAGGKLGWGNLHRILIFYDYFKKKKSLNTYLFVKGNEDVFNFLKKKKVKFLKINNLSLKKEELKLKKIGKADISFIEVLNPTLSLQKIYKDNSKKLVVLDDILKSNYISEILFSCQKNNNPIKKDIKQIIYNDFKYFPLRDNFNPFLNKKKKIRKKISKVVVFLGGGNYRSVYLKVAKILNNMNFRVDFLVGSERCGNIKSKVESLNRNFNLFVNLKNIPKKIFEADLVICGGGYTKIETAYLKTPLICLSVQKHQNNLAENFRAQFGIEFIRFKKNYDPILKKLIMKQNFKKRMSISNKFSRYFSVNGLDRIITKTMH
jgi:spore coat polysaccharide biosynthesis predicted glycosyltransferase SpsG